MMSEPSYEEQLAHEAALWGADAERSMRSVPPDWRYHQNLRHNLISHKRDINTFLDQVQPGAKALAMAQRGADATGIDISERALDIVREYYESIRDEVLGSATYQIADLNRISLPREQYDVIAIKGTLHHLVQMDHVIAEIHNALKPGGLLWVCDSHGNEALSTALVASALMFVLPTHVSYGDKIKGLLRFGVGAPGRIKASIEAEGLSPFEGAGREYDWLKLIGERFRIERRIDAPAVTGYIAHQVSLPDWAALPLLRVLRVVDEALVRFRVLHNTGVTLYARKV